MNNNLYTLKKYACDCTVYFVEAEVVYFHMTVKWHKFTSSILRGNRAVITETKKLDHVWSYDAFTLATWHHWFDVDSNFLLYRQFCHKYNHFICWW